MAILFSRSFTAADTTPWTSAGFSLVLGNVAALIYGNAGLCGTIEQERIFRATAFPQTPNYKALVTLTWKNAAGAGRIAGIALRASSDGKDAYLFELDSNVGSARVRIRRRRNDTVTDLTGWIDVSGSPYFVGSSELNAGVTMTARIENVEAEKVNLQLSLDASNGNPCAEVDDTSAVRIDSGGGAGLVIGQVSKLDDVVYDELQVRDFEDEYPGAPEELDEKIALVVDGTSYSWDQLVGAGVKVSLVRETQGDEVAAQFVTRDHVDQENPVLYPGAVVTVALKDAIVAFGRIRPARRAIDPREGHAYDLITPKRLAADVPIRDPVTNAEQIQWNLPEEHQEYDPLRADMTVGESIAEVLDAHADGDGMLRDQLAAPPDEDEAPYEQADLDAITTKVPGMAASQDVYAGIETLLSFTKFACKIDPATRKWRFYDRISGTETQVDVGLQHVTGEIQVNPDDNFTAVEVRGDRPETTMSELTNDGGGLDAGWDAGLEGTHDQGKSWKNKDSGTVLSSAGAGDPVTLVPDAPFEMDAHEWYLGALRFTSGPESGNGYRVNDNTALQFEMKGPWKAGGPNLGDTFDVEGDAKGGGRDNGHRVMGRLFTLTDPDKGIAPDACAKVSVKLGNMEIQTQATTTTPDDPSRPAEVELDLPAIGLINYQTPPAEPADPCKEGDAEATAQAIVKIEVPTYDRTLPWVPTLRVPTAGFRGTAYATDSAKWNGGGKPGRGDPAVMRVYGLNAPQFDGSAAMVTAFTAVADDLLGLFGELAYEVQIEIKGVLDTQWAGLGRTLKLVDTTGARDFSFLDDVTLSVVAVEWDVENQVTRVFAGTKASGRFNLDALRRALMAKHRAERQKTATQRLEELMACLSSQAQQVGQDAPTPVCAERVVMQRPNGGKTTNLKIEIEIIIDILEIIFDILEFQKGGDFWVDPDTGDVWYTDPFGTHWLFDPDTGLWSDGFGGFTDTPWDTGGGLGGAPDGVADGGSDAILLSLIQGLAQQLGKTLLVDADGALTGEIGVPGAVAPNGGLYFPPGGAGPVDLPPGSTVPPTVLGEKHATEKGLGLDPVELGDPGGEVYLDGMGDLWRPAPNTPGSYEGGHTWERQQPAEGGPGTGTNGGDYEPHPEQRDFIPARSQQLDDGENQLPASHMTDGAMPGNPDHVQAGGAVLHDTGAGPMPPGWVPDPMLMGALPPPPGYEWIKKE